MGCQDCPDRRVIAALSVAAKYGIPVAATRS